MISQVCLNREGICTWSQQLCKGTIIWDMGILPARPNICPANPFFLNIHCVICSRDTVMGEIEIGPLLLLNSSEIHVTLQRGLWCLGSTKAHKVISVSLWYPCHEVVKR